MLEAIIRVMPQITRIPPLVIESMPIAPAGLIARLYIRNCESIS